MKKQLMELAVVGATLTACSDVGPTASAPSESVIPPSTSDIASPTAPENTASPVESSEDLLARQVNEYVARTQAALTAVSAEKLQEYITVVQTQGYIDEDFTNKDVIRYVVTASDGTVYTNQLDFLYPAGTPGENPVESVGVFVDRPGEELITPYVEDGSSVSVDPRIIIAVDGKLDLIDGYSEISTEQSNQLQEVYGIFVWDALRAVGLEAAGQAAQQDYITAVDLTVSANIR